MGTDLLLMGAYRFKKYIALDFGGAFAKLKNIVSGYCNGIVGAAAFNQEGSHTNDALSAIRVSRNKNALFTRLQPEF